MGQPLAGRGHVMGKAYVSRAAGDHAGVELVHDEELVSVYASDLSAVALAQRLGLVALETNGIGQPPDSRSARREGADHLLVRLDRLGGALPEADVVGAPLRDPPRGAELLLIELSAPAQPGRRRAVICEGGRPLRADDVQIAVSLGREGDDDHGTDRSEKLSLGHGGSALKDSEHTPRIRYHHRLSDGIPSHRS